MSLADAPISMGGLCSSVPPIARSVLKEFTNTHPSLGPLPKLARSCQ